MNFGKITSAPTLQPAQSACVASVETEPVVAVRQDHPDALSEVNRQWSLYASENGLFADDGTFLISVAGRGSSKFGWARVKWSEGCALAERLQDEGSPEYVGMSLDGRCICAVTTEECDYWIVVHRFE